MERINIRPCGALLDSAVTRRSAQLALFSLFTIYFNNRFLFLLSLFRLRAFNQNIQHNCVVISKRKVSDLSPAVSNLTEKIFTFDLDWILFSNALS